MSRKLRAPGLQKGICGELGLIVWLGCSSSFVLKVSLCNIGTEEWTHCDLRQKNVQSGAINQQRYSVYSKVSPKL